MTLINCDMGESFGLYSIGDDEAMMQLISVANVACGFHASDFNHMRATVRLAKANGVKVGAHPSLPDLQGFGRREMKMPREELANCMIYQIGALKGFLDAEGMQLNHIKPHGALYGMAARMEEVAHAVADAADVFRVPILGMAGTCHETVYKARGHRFVAVLRMRVEAEHLHLQWRARRRTRERMDHGIVPLLRRRCAMVSDKIRDREVNFMTDGGDHRHRTGKNRPRDDFFVKSPKVLQRATPPADNHDFDVRRT